MATSVQSAPRSRLGQWLDERLGLQGIAYPVPEHANSLPYLLGGVTFSGFLIVFITGIYLAQFYHPHVEEAHQSLIYIIAGVPLGDLVRSIHFWTAQIVTVTVLLHLLRVLFTGSYKRPREVNWFVGLGLLAATLGLVFTGSVLKFDQEGMEALQHNKEAAGLVGMMGAWFSAEFSRSVPIIMRLYTGHATILPLIFGLLILVHIYLIKQHGIAPKVTAEAVTRLTSGEGESNFGLHLRRMIGFGLILLSAALLLSLIFPAPLGMPGVAGVEVTKPWWMFLWLFPAEATLGARALVIVPAVLGILLALAPIVDRSPYLSPARRKGLLIVAGLILVVIVVAGIVAEFQPVTQHLMK